MPHKPTAIVRSASANLRLQLATSCFNGVWWRPALQKYQAELTFAGKTYYLGLFLCERQAAFAYDAKLRDLCKGHDGHRLKASLNFPSMEESAFTETRLEKRARDLQRSHVHAGKERRAFTRVLQELQKSAVSSSFEIVPVSSSSRVDAIFRRKGSAGGLPLQLKSSSGGGTHGRYYCFKRVQGYDGMLLLLIALDCDMFWAVPGASIVQHHIFLVLGGTKDHALRVGSLSEALQGCFYKAEEYPHVTLEEARLQCGNNNYVEEQARRQSEAVLRQAGFRSKPYQQVSTVDSVLSGYGRKYAVQEKASHRRRCERDYVASLSKKGGALGRIPYESIDFDLLIISLLDDAHQLEGIYLMPTSALAQRGLVDERPVTLHLYPPWAPAKHTKAVQKHAWQLDYFVDLRGWTGGPLSGETVGRLLQVLLDPEMVSKSITHMCFSS